MNNLYVKTGIEKIFVGIVEGNLYVNNYWNGGYDSCLENELDLLVTTVGIRNDKIMDFDFHYYINIDNETIEITKENTEKLYYLLLKK